MKALVTGASGFIGGHLTERLIEKGYRVKVLVRRTSNLQWLKGLDIETVYGDIREPESLIPAVEGVDYIFHIAGETKTKSPEVYDKVNYEGTKNIFNISSQENPKLKKFVFFSSQAAAGPSPSLKPLKEEDPPNPVSAYGRSKLKAEKFLLENSHTLPWIILRPPLIYGPRDPETLLFFQILKTRIRPGIIRYLSVCYVKDLVEATILAAESDKRSSIYFISDGDIYTLDEISLSLGRIMGRKTFRVPLPTKILYLYALLLENIVNKPTVLNRERVVELSQRYWICDSSKIRRELGFKPRYPLEEGVRETLNWYIENRWL